MERLTIGGYAKRIGISRQAVWKSVNTGNRKNLPNVTSIEMVESALNKKIYILTYNPESNEI